MDRLVMMSLLGGAGAFVYAGSRLITLVLGDQELPPRATQRAWAQFAVAMFFGPIASVVFSPSILRWNSALDPFAVSVAIGLCANALWPVFVDDVVPAFRKALGHWLSELGASISRDGDGSK